MSGDIQNGIRNGIQTDEQEDLTCPFFVKPLNHDDTSTPNDYPLHPIFPASYRTTSDDLATSTKDIAACIRKELDLHRLQIIFSRLWIVGRPVPPRSLHYQLLLSRDIFVTEQMDMHLVWSSGRIFIKPIPRFLLVPRFWSEHLSCLPCCNCTRPRSRTSSVGDTLVDESACDRRRLWKSALGFLFSYAALVSHESDFAIAQEKKLIPTEVTWADWTSLVGQVLATDHIYEKIDARFIYGELRLSRLNKIYRFAGSSFLRGYMSQWNRYGDFFQDNLAWLAAATVYVALVLTAMQVGLATESLGGNNAFQSASYGFAAFSILGPLIAFSLIVLTFCYMFINNWISSIAQPSTSGQTPGSAMTKMAPLCSDGNTVKLWDAQTGQEQQTLEGHSSWVESVAFSPDGHTVASGSGDKTIKLWDAQTGSELQTLEGNPDSVASILSRIRIGTKSNGPLDIFIMSQ